MSVAAEAPHARSLTARLALALGLVLALGSLAVALAAFLYGRHAAQQSYDRLLIGAANQIAESITIRDGAVEVDLPVSAFRLLSLAPDDRITYAVFAPDGQVITGYEDQPPLPDGQTYGTGRFAGEEVRLVQVRRTLAERSFSGTIRVVVGQTTRARAALAREITQSALAATALVGMAISFLAALAVRSSLHPLRQIEQTLADRPAQDLSPLAIAAPREIDSLVATLNRFIARLDRQFEVMRNLIADTSHQLRTPIAALRVQAELARDEADPARLQAILARIHQRASGLGRLSDQLLNHALIIHRADSVALDPLDLRRVAIRAVEETDHDPLSAGAELALDLPDEPVWCRGDALSLTEACKNLAGNALRHGKAPVQVAVRLGSEGPELVVWDAGTGIPPDHWADAGLRYRRRSGVSATSAGLGLAIAAAVAKAHGGRLGFDRPATGGFAATLHLPAPETAP